MKKVRCKCKAGFSQIAYDESCYVESFGKFFVKLRKTTNRHIVVYCPLNTFGYYFEEVWS